MRLFDIRKLIVNVICFIIIIIGIITCSCVLSYDLSESFISNDLIDNYKDNNVTFAIYVENDDGEYEEYTKSISSFSSTFSNLVYNEDYSGCTDYDGNVLTGVLSYEDGVASVNTEVTTYCTLYFELPFNCVRDGVTSLSECILRSENNFDSEEEAITYIKSKGTPDFSSVATTDEGLYYAEDDYGDSYYFRGAVEDNYVYFAGYYWRVIRINGDGSIRLIYDGTSAYANGLSSNDRYTYANGTSSADRYISQRVFNSGYNTNAYVGYMYGDVYTENASTTTTATLQSYYYYYGTDYDFDDTTGKYTLSGTVSRLLWSSNLEGMYTCRRTSASGTCTSLWKIDTYTNNYQGTYYIYSSTSETDENNVTTYTESQGTTTSTGTFATRYYYGTDYTYDPNVGYTLVSYAYNIYDGTGTLTDLTDYYTCGSTSYTKCTTLYHIESASSATVANVTKYTLSTNSYAIVHENKNNSTIKGVVDNWYATNIYNKTDGTNSYDDYISDTSFCNDRSVYSGTGIGTTQTYYGAYNRLYTNKSPILTCPNKTNDAFTVDDEVNGNGALTYKVGLITADEVAMAGAVYNTSNTSYYLYIGNYYWTMSPSYFNGPYAFGWLVTSAGFHAGYYVVSTSYGVRPVINLSPFVILTSGDGTMDNPYQVSLS